MGGRQARTRVALFVAQEFLPTARIVSSLGFSAVSAFAIASTAERGSQRQHVTLAH